MTKMNDERGCSSCLAGEEIYEYFWSVLLKKELCHYEYRTLDGKLFSVIRKDLEACREARDRWLEKHGLTLEGSATAQVAEKGSAKEEM